MVIAFWLRRGGERPGNCSPTHKCNKLPSLHKIAPIEPEEGIRCRGETYAAPQWAHLAHVGSGSTASVRAISAAGPLSPFQLEPTRCVKDGLQSGIVCLAPIVLADDNATTPER